MIGKKTSLLTYLEPQSYHIISYHKYGEFKEILKHELNELKIKREEKTKMGNGETFDVALAQKIKKGFHLPNQRYIKKSNHHKEKI